MSIFSIGVDAVKLAGVRKEKSLSFLRNRLSFLSSFKRTLNSCSFLFKVVAITKVSCFITGWWLVVGVVVVVGAGVVVGVVVVGVGVVAGVVVGVAAVEH
jgi:hypothetical protein